jgi:hypothetical protein
LFGTYVPATILSAASNKILASIHKIVTSKNILDKIIYLSRKISFQSKKFTITSNLALNENVYKLFDALRPDEHSLRYWVWKFK